MRFCYARLPPLSLRQPRCAFDSGALLRYIRVTFRLRFDYFFCHADFRDMLSAVDAS